MVLCQVRNQCCNNLRAPRLAHYFFWYKTWHLLAHPPDSLSRALKDASCKTPFFDVMEIGRTPQKWYADFPLDWTTSTFWSQHPLTWKMWWYTMFVLKRLDTPRTCSEDKGCLHCVSMHSFSGLPFWYSFYVDCKMSLLLYWAVPSTGSFRRVNIVPTEVVDALHQGLLLLMDKILHHQGWWLSHYF